ncbi:hypothetical protein FVA74_04535 [Salinibacterium sp. dk2585]|uniref:aggregation-promoting factor C-terminal-like domain-containing protein n=1 Tax=unclassified Salinibacterium TaxID=2632331 RepID=UPI0011C24FA0|nr:MULTISPECIES: hypothetical protein [unclassified Salinibacterium]QEE60929.1 hypothetical protein FVA74_04535 [Salinibacterium sp. dk2585]TXK56000.1 hypothetical protein FVP63_04680 [Salinibacterium sp. dk5596]
MPLNTAQIYDRIPARTRPGLIITGAVLALGAMLGTGATIQASAAEFDERIAAGEIADEDLKASLRDEKIAAVVEQRLAEEAQGAIASATPVIAAANGKADASALAASVASLAQHEVLEPVEVVSLVASVEAAIPAVQAAVAEADRLAAEADRLAAERAAQAAAALATPAGAQAHAREVMAQRYGWGADQASCLVNLWQKESGWRWDALNPSSGATGIPQSLPGSKMATHGADWQTNPATQISWGLDYIKRAYGTPCGAWGKSQAVGWY